jgi:hypothetical protein
MKKYKENETEKDAHYLERKEFIRNKIDAEKLTNDKLKNLKESDENYEQIVKEVLGDDIDKINFSVTHENKEVVPPTISENDENEEKDEKDENVEISSNPKVTEVGVETKPETEIKSETKAEAEAVEVEADKETKEEDKKEK